MTPSSPKPNASKRCSRQANAVLIEADGKRDAQLALDKLMVEQLAQKLRKKQRQLRECTKTLGQHKEGKVLRLSPEKARKLRLRIYGLKTALARLGALLERLTQGLTSMAFGSKKLLRERSALPRQRTSNPGASGPLWQLAARAQPAHGRPRSSSQGRDGAVP